MQTPDIINFISLSILMLFLLQINITFVIVNKVWSFLTIKCLYMQRFTFKKSMQQNLLPIWQCSQYPNGSTASYQTYETTAGEQIVVGTPSGQMEVHAVTNGSTCSTKWKYMKYQMVIKPVYKCYYTSA